MVNNDHAGERTQTHGALAVASRLRLLDALRATDQPLDVQELASACGLHITTVRFHLDVLTHAGLVRGHTSRSGTRGRPRLRYTPASRTAGAGDRTGYELLAEILAAHWAGDRDERAHRAEQAGWAWAAPPGPASGPTATVATLATVGVNVNAVFAELGIDPELASEGEDLRFRLHACPFQAIAERHPEVVCSIHLGLLRRAIAEVGAPPVAVNLQPFVQPHLCVADISAAPEPTHDGAIPPLPSLKGQS